MQKDTDNLTEFLRFWDLHMLKLFLNMLVKSTPVRRGRHDHHLLQPAQDPAVNRLEGDEVYFVENSLQEQTTLGHG